MLEVETSASSSSSDVAHIVQWDCQRVWRWLKEVNLENLQPTFEKNEINGEKLLILDSNSLRDLGVSKVQHRAQFSYALKSLLTQNSSKSVTETNLLGPPDAPKINTSCSKPQNCALDSAISLIAPARRNAIMIKSPAVTPPKIPLNLPAGYLGDSSGELDRKDIGKNFGNNGYRDVFPNEVLSSSPAGLQSNEDIFSLDIVRNRCIRVYGQISHHIIDVRDLDPEGVRRKIFAKFNIQGDAESEYELFSVDEYGVDDDVPITNNQLRYICKTPDSIERGRLYLVRVHEPQPNKQASLLKLQNFFGTKQLPKETVINRLLTNPQDKFGDRPTSDLIAHELPRFFPTIADPDMLDSSLTSQIIERTTSLKLRNSLKKSAEQKRASRSNSESKVVGSIRHIDTNQYPKLAEAKPQEKCLTDEEQPEVFAFDEDISKVDTKEIPKDTVAPLSVEQSTKINWIKSYLIRKGSFGKVFLGLDCETGQFLAVKQVEIRKQLVGPAKRMLDSLNQEISLLRELQHENIVRYLGFELSDATLSVFLEYVSGGSVKSLIGKIGAFEETLVQSLVSQTVCGVKYLHDKKIVHRDIKCANILVDENGVVKIADFGISKKSGMNPFFCYINNSLEIRKVYQRDTRMSLQGTVEFMAPEILSGKGYSAKIDIWSLGCSAVEMITGKLPWSVVSERVPYLLGKGHKPTIPEGLSPMQKDFLELCFTIDPEQRPTAEDLSFHPFLSKFDSTNFSFPIMYALKVKRREEEEDTSSDEETGSEDDTSDEETNAL